MQAPQKRTRKKTNLGKTVALAFLGIGSALLFTSIVFVSSILAFIGLSLLFWGALLLYIQPEEHIKKTLLDSALLPSLSTLNQIIHELDYKGKAIYLPPKYFKDPGANKVYIPKQQEEELEELPPPEHILMQESHLFFEDPEGVLLTPPGAQLTSLFEKMLGTNFAQKDLQYVTQNMPKLFIEDLEIAKNLEIETIYDTIHVKITDPILKDICNKNRKLSHISGKLGCPVCSSIAAKKSV